MKSLKPLCEHYFELFSNKNSDGLSDMFSDSIRLKDWLVSIKGKDDVLSEMNRTFDATEKINIDIKEMYEECNTVCCEITIDILTNDDKIKIEVVDIITFDDLMKIKKIVAYKI